MSNGVPWTLADFGWSSSLTFSLQREKVQSAFDSGEPLWWPRGEQVIVDDVGLTMNAPTHIRGHGCDATLAGIAPSQLSMPGSPTESLSVLRILSHNVTIEGLDVSIGTLNTGDARSTGIVIGDSSPTGPDPFGVSLRRVSTGGNLGHGITVLSGQHFVAEDCTVNCWGGDALRMNNRNADEGDNQIVRGRYAGWGWQAGLQPNCIHLMSGGGFTITPGTKLLDCYCHVKVDWFTGGSGGFQMDTASLENCHGPISVDMDGTQPFTRCAILGTSFGNGSVAVAVRNFHATPWLHNLAIVGNPIDVGLFGTQVVPAIDIGCADGVEVSSNPIRGAGVVGPAIVVRNPCQGHIGKNEINGFSIKTQTPDGNTTTVIDPQP